MIWSIRIAVISIHAPAEGATLMPGLRPCRQKHFNPRSRGGSDSANVGVSFALAISIHAPAEGATRRCTWIRRGVQISIHAPAEGATVAPLEFDIMSNDFNPRSRGGSDGNPHNHVCVVLISIHAPAEGATNPPATNA